MNTSIEAEHVVSRSQLQQLLSGSRSRLVGANVEAESLSESYIIVRFCKTTNLAESSPTGAVLVNSEPASQKG